MLWLVPPVALVCLLAAAALGADDPGASEEAPVHETIDLTPPEPAGFGIKNVAAPLGSLFLGFGHYYAPRKLEVDTTPSGGLVDLFYVRSSFQKRFEQAETPVTVLLPPRVDVGPRDSVTIRAFREGFRQKTVTLKVASSVDQVVIDLDPLPNTLEAVSHRYFAGRSAIGFLTKEALTFRVQEADDGFSVILTETAMGKEAEHSVESLQSPLIHEVYGQQLGEDLLVHVGLSDAARGTTEVRSRQAYNAARDLYEFTIELVPKDGGATAVQTALDSLAAIRPADVTGCALPFDTTLRSELDPGALNRALSPQGSFTDRYLRAAMRRLGEVTPGGVVEFTNGTKYSPAVPIELEMALTQSALAKGYLALLQRFVYGIEKDSFRVETFRGLVAPELDASSFGVALDKAEGARQSCRAAIAKR